jgi:aminoglycoside/choline kinase family phosphotransferase
MSMILPERLEQMRALLSPTSFADAQLQPLAADASFRRYVRVVMPDATAMLMDAPPDKENVRPYLATAEYLNSKGYSAPNILARDIDSGLLLLEDLGDDSFTRILKRDASEATQYQLYSAAIDLLAQWHDESRGFSNPHALRAPTYDQALLIQEVKLFTDWYLPQALGVEQAVALRPKFLELWQSLLLAIPLAQTHWVHRDYHADNLMWLPQRSGLARVGLLDFQDGVYGDAAYDLVSLLEDARRDVPPALASVMLERYIAASRLDAERFRAAYALLGAQRNCKIIGIFVRLAVRDQKPHYLSYLPRVWAHLECDISHPLLQPLKHWFDLHVPLQARGVLRTQSLS